MVESQQVLEWQNEARVATKAKDILRFLELRFPPGLPAEAAATIRATTDLAQLDRWVDAAATAASLDEFRQSAQV